MFARASQKLAVLGVLSVLAGSALAGFQYQSNDVVFDGGSFGISSGNFSVYDLSISSGQDPDHLNNVGDVHILDSSSKAFTFTVGRHKTSQVADFWNGYVKSSQTSANDKPGSLNFAFYGDLVLQLQNPPTTVYAHNILLGQGSYPMGFDTVSNWWFGGLSCTYIGSSTARCIAYDSAGKQLSLDFKHTEMAEQIPQNDGFITKYVPNVVHLVAVNY